MKLKTKLFIYFGLPTALLVGVMYYYILSSIFKEFNNLEVEFAKTNKSRVEAIIENEINNLQSVTINWSVWDDTYNFVNKPTKHYTFENFYNGSFYDLKINYVFVLNNKGEIVYSRYFNYLNKSHDELNPAFLDDFNKTIGNKIASSNLIKTIKGITEISRFPLLYSIEKVYRSDYQGDSNGYIIFMRAVDNEFLSQISNLMKMDIKISETKSTEVYESTEDINIIIPFHDHIKEQSSHYALEMRMSKSVSKQSLLSVQRVGWTGAVLILVSVMLIYYIIKFTIINRIVDISKKLSRLSQSSDLTYRFSENTKDEFEELTNEINKMFDRISRDQVKFNQTSRLTSLGEMAGGIAHEINNPLAIISGNAYLIKSLADNPNPDKNEIINMAAKIDSTVKRIQTIIKSLKTISREGSSDPLEVVAVKDLVAESLTLSENKLKNTNINLLLPEFSPFLYINVRPVQIIQVLINLINNAKYAVQDLEERWIKIVVEDNQKTILIKVIDSGKGIPKEIRQKIMEPFFTTKPVGQGTGLGLSISKSMIESNGGFFYYDESSPNTSFVIELPKAQSLRKVG